MKKTTLALILVAIFQLAVLGVEISHGLYPHYAGKEIYLKTVPVDPRSMFRGQYVRLNYDISRINRSDITDLKDEGYDLYDRPVSQIYPGVKIYIVLEDKGDHHAMKHAQLEKPKEGLFIRGKIDGYLNSYSSTLDVRYGIEAYFANPDRAKELEEQARNRTNTLIAVKVAPNGQVALVDM